MSPEHENLFSFLCILERVTRFARRQKLDDCLLTLHKINITAIREMGKVSPDARVALRVRLAMEQVIRTSGVLPAHTYPYVAVESVNLAAVMGTRKSELLKAVSDRTWREQCAGRANLAMKRDFPEFSTCYDKG